MSLDFRSLLQVRSKCQALCHYKDEAIQRRGFALVTLQLEAHFLSGNRWTDAGEGCQHRLIDGLGQSLLVNRTWQCHHLPLNAVLPFRS